MSESRPGTCRGPTCGAAIIWVKNPKTGRWQPRNPDGTPHHATCPDVAQFRGQKQTPLGPVPRRLMDDDK